jgi:hypothetical protein
MFQKGFGRYLGGKVKKGKKQGWGEKHCDDREVFGHHNYVAIKFSCHPITPTKFDRHWEIEFNHHPTTLTKFSYHQTKIMYFNRHRWI